MPVFHARDGDTRFDSLQQVLERLSAAKSGAISASVMPSGLAMSKSRRAGQYEEPSRTRNEMESQSTLSTHSGFRRAQQYGPRPRARIGRRLRTEMPDAVFIQQPLGESAALVGPVQAVRIETRIDLIQVADLGRFPGERGSLAMVLCRIIIFMTQSSWGASPIQSPPAGAAGCLPRGSGSRAHRGT